MSYDTKAQKNRAELLENGAAFSTLFFVEEEAAEETSADDQPPIKSSENAAD